MKDFAAEIDKSLDLLFEVVDKTSEKNDLLDTGKLVYLQVVIFKIPFIRKPMRKFLKLRHSIYGDDPDVCLFVPNRISGKNYKITTDECIDLSVDYFTEFLEKHKVKGIHTIMPLKQLKSEYGVFELRRKLVRRFDVFLCKTSLLYNRRFLTGLGKIFKVANKNPLGVSFPPEDSEYDPQFQKNIDNALKTSNFYIKPFSDNYTIPIGRISNSKKELKENIKTSLDQICAENYIPGGFKNIKYIYLWPSQSKAIPLYICPEIPEHITFKSGKKKKDDEVIQGELSTQPGKKVTVMKNGEVFISKLEKGEESEMEFDFEDDESFDDGSEEEDTSKNENKNNKKTKKKEIAENENGNETESEDDDDDDKIEEIEQRLLRQSREIGYNTFETPKEEKKSKVEKNKKQKNKVPHNKEEEKEYTTPNKKMKMNQKEKNNKTEKKKENRGKIRGNKKKRNVKFS